MTDAWPWLALAGPRALHWLHPRLGGPVSGRPRPPQHPTPVRWLSLAPLALGHAISVAAVAAAFVAAGLLIDPRAVRVASGLILIGWAIYHWAYRHRHRVRFGMQAGLVGLGVWSFLMATAHGA